MSYKQVLFHGMIVGKYLTQNLICEKWEYLNILKGGKMKWLPIFLLLFIFGCSSTQFVTYRPLGSTAKNWDINVKKSSITNNFQVIINDSTVIDESANLFTGNLQAEGLYRKNQIKLMVTYSSGFLGIGAGYDAMVFVNNELAGKFDFQ